MVHDDKKHRKYYLLPDEEEPHRTTPNKRSSDIFRETWCAVFVKETTVVRRSDNRERDARNQKMSL